MRWEESIKEEEGEKEGGGLFFSSNGITSSSN